MLVDRELCLVSTRGASADTCTDSTTPASCSVKVTVLIWPSDRGMFSTFELWNPVS